jgi:hypothetical protein
MQLANPSNQRGQRDGSDGDEEEDGIRLTCLRYHAYRIHSQESQNGLLLRGGKLFQQYIVDAWAQVEQSRLQWLRHIQKTLRAEVYSSLTDALAGGEDLAQIGKWYILPSSHIGSPRSMQQLYQDSMAICRKHVKPTYFTTMTANPHWKEIVDELLPGQTPSDRPDLIARVFNQKLKHLRYLLDEKDIYGGVKAHVYAIESQKRGLPHTHNLDFVTPEDQPKTPEDVDKVISACLPDKTLQPELWNLVTKFMMHGPCGSAFPNAPCMVDGKCSKGYPKPFRAETSIDNNGYPDYKRPDDGRFIEKQGVKLTNQWVVPYVPELLLALECHVNTECCAGIGSVKYIHKYIYKGPDRATLRITDKEEVDEIKQFLDARWIGASEAAWRLFRNKMHEEKPPVYRLQVCIYRIQYLLIVNKD